MGKREKVLEYRQNKSKEHTIYWNFLGNDAISKFQNAFDYNRCNYICIIIIIMQIISYNDL